MLPSNKLPNFVLHSFGVVHKLPTFVLHSFGVMNNLQVNETQSLTCIKGIQERLTINKRLKTLKSTNLQWRLPKNLGLLVLYLYWSNIGYNILLGFRTIQIKQWYVTQESVSNMVTPKK